MSVDPNKTPSAGPRSPEWGSDAVMSLFQSVAKLQVEIGIIEAWKEWNLSGLATSTGRFMPPVNYSSILSAIHSELPLAVTKLQIDHGEAHEDYVLGLVKLNPATGEMVPDTWAYAAELEDGVINSRYSPYNADQLAAIHWQLEAQSILGIELTPGQTNQ